MRKVRLADLATVIRSKNSGPYELTMDIFFKSEAIYRRAKQRRLIDEPLVERLYHVRRRDILGIIYFDPVQAVKITIARPVPSGNVADTDVYGAQQHMPLVDAAVEWES